MIGSSTASKAEHLPETESQSQSHEESLRGIGLSSGEEIQALDSKEKDPMAPALPNVSNSSSLQDPSGVSLAEPILRRTESLSEAALRGAFRRNQLIVKAKSVETVLDVWGRSGNHFSVVNTSTAFHRIGKVASCNLGPSDLGVSQILNTWVSFH